MTDECYSHFLYDGEPFSVAALPGAKETVLVAGTLSKTYAMTGWRIGYGLVPAPIVAAMTEAAEPLDFEPHVDRAEGRGGSAAAVRRIRCRRCWPNTAGAAISWCRACARFPASNAPMPAGAFYAYPNMRGAMDRGGIRTPLEFAERLLAEASVAVVPGEAFGTNDHVRMSYATSMGGTGAGPRSDSEVRREPGLNAAVPAGFPGAARRSGDRRGLSRGIGIRMRSRIGEIWFPASDSAASPGKTPVYRTRAFRYRYTRATTTPGRMRAGRRGKTEMWHVLRAEPGAKLALGLREAVVARACARRGADRRDRRHAEVD